MVAAILPLACRFPDAMTPNALWANVLGGRRSFRALPPERIELARYASDLVGEADSITPVKAGLLAGWRFDCERFLIPHATFERTDLTHWLSLEVAAEAIGRAGGIDRFNRERTAVVVGNTLTGEFSRASMLRLRLPFLDEVLARATAAAGLDGSVSSEVRCQFAATVREHFPSPQEDTLSGGLANTIAGRIANYFDLHGGAYTVDAACASSLVALANAADLLALGRADAVIVGAVDLSIDPFELVGFSRNGALARDDMRVFDERSCGFWPGEGAAFTVLMRETDARQQDLPVQALLRGWGISTDGAGGFTRPAVDGQLLALRRAYQAAGVDPSDVGYVEAHGTGTAVGDPVEVRSLAALRNGAGRSLPIGSIKANIGHTKAAAGFASLIKAVSALKSGVVPPHVGCSTPHPVFRHVDHCVRPALAPELWPAGAPALAGVSGFGFGGVNVHLVLEKSGKLPSSIIVPPAPRQQDVELFAFAAETAGDIGSQLSALQVCAATLTSSELTDAAAHCARASGKGPLRVSIVAGGPEELERKLAQAAAAIGQSREVIDLELGVFVARRQEAARVGFLFPGQAAPARVHGGLWARRFDHVSELLAQVPNTGDNPAHTAIAQPAIAAASLAGWRILREAGIDAVMVAGHSLGELTALASAGSIDENDLVPLAASRGAAIAAHSLQCGGMLRIAAASEQVCELVCDLDLALACDNGPSETVVSGPPAAMIAAENWARRRGFETTRLCVSHAFHSSMIAPAALPFASVLSNYTLRPVQRKVFSTVLGQFVGPTDDIRNLLVRQLVAPVQFGAALRQLAKETDLLIEVGPGFGLTRLAQNAGHAATSIDAFGDSLAPLFAALGAAFVQGVPVRLDPLFCDRDVRPIDLTTRPQSLVSPCGRLSDASVPLVVPLDGLEAVKSPIQNSQANLVPQEQAKLVPQDDVLAVVRAAIAEQTGFEPTTIGNDSRFLDHLHLNSISVARVVTRAAQALGISSPSVPTEFANATAHELAAGLAMLRDLAPEENRGVERVAGVRPWVRTFAVRWVERPVSECSPRLIKWKAVVISGSEEDHQLVETIENHTGEPNGLLIWIGWEVDETSTYDLFSTCRLAWSNAAITHLAICHAGAPVAAFARSVAIEARFQSVAVIERPFTAKSEFILNELDRATTGFSEVRINSNGHRFEPEFAPIAPIFHASAMLDRRDVILVTGGAKGIGAECALRVATRTRAVLVLVGRSPEHDAEVVATLERAKASGIQCRYVAADVTNAAGLAQAVSHAAGEVGPITALIHTAGTNDPALFDNITDDQLRSVLAPKTTGLRAAVAAAGPRLRRIVVFGSILGRMGLKGEAHYSVANAWAAAIAERISCVRGKCDVLSLEWSIWNGPGMGHRLGSLERLARFGVDAIALEDGLAAFERLVLGGAVGTMMVTSRFGPPREVSLEHVELPMLRFIDKPLVHYPGLELVVETSLSTGRDRYLVDHRIEGVTVLPCVFALEAMAQVATALVGHTLPVSIEAVSFPKAIVVSENRALRIQILTLTGEDGRVEAVIRAEDDDFATDRTRATFVFGARRSSVARDETSDSVNLDARPLYGSLFFQGERFRQLRRYTAVSARRIRATLAPRHDCSWFGVFEPQRLILGDPGARDALLHALQAAVPHLRVVPVSVEQIVFHKGGEPFRVDAVERGATDDTFVFDIVAYDDTGAIVEEWTAAAFRALSDIAIRDVLPVAPELAAAYIERVAREALSDTSIEISIIADPACTRDERRARALAALGLTGQALTRSDGKPIIITHAPRGYVSISHRDAVTLVAKANSEIGCDIEFITELTSPQSAVPLSASARSLAAKVAASTAEPWAVAAARFWALAEVGLKNNRRINGSGQAFSNRRAEIVIFEASSGRTMTLRISLPQGDMVVAVGTVAPSGETSLAATGIIASSP